MWRAKTPAVPEEFSAGGVVLDVGGELEGFARAFRRGDEPNELTRFAPEIFFTAPLDVFQSACRPVRDRSENGSGSGTAIGFPKIAHNRLPGRKPLQVVRRDGEAIGADVFAEREEGVMTLEVIDRR